MTTQSKQLRSTGPATRRRSGGAKLVFAGMTVLAACHAPSTAATLPSAKPPSAQEDPTTAPSPPPSAPPPSPPTPHATNRIEAAVPAAAPVALTIPALDLATEVDTMPAAECPVLNPPTIEYAYWVECRAMPGTDSNGATFIIGHTIPGGTGVFARLHSITPGTDVVVETPTGTLTYRVERTTHYDKYGEAQRAVDMRERVPGRLVLVTCAPEADPVVEQNLVVFATLVGATAE